MKKIFLPIILFCLLSIIFIPVLANAQGPIVQCGNEGQNACGILDFFAMLARIYNFIVLYIATPLAVIALVVGGILLLISAGNPNLAGMGKKIIYAAIIGLVLVFCSYLIINFVLSAIGYTGNWPNP
ncbi:MAG: hypothetical protein NTY81_01540 [Candidatus Staskawiczbacteria bacterium]|nr:hypothetical protein [Candidatus Staskawiczbacteria bacterium]